jgi:DNA-binding XRE family transcriptional regulator
VTRSASVDEAREALRTGVGLREQDGCFIWESPAPNGYGPYLSFWLAEHDAGPSDGQSIVWTCGNGPNGCVNPAHLALATPEETERHRAQPLDGKDRVAWAQAMAAEREVRGWSQSRMARELSVSPTTIKNWESQRTAPSRTMARMVGYKLGWELTERKWVVHFIVKDVVVARTAGEAAQRAGSALALDPPRKTAEVYSVRAVR